MVLTKNLRLSCAPDHLQHLNLVLRRQWVFLGSDVPAFRRIARIDDARKVELWNFVTIDHMGRVADGGSIFNAARVCYILLLRNV